MVRTGIYTPLQLKDLARTKDRVDAVKRISVTLYDQIIDEPNADELAEIILIGFSDERGMTKRTYARRFEAFDQEVMQLLHRGPPSQEPLVVQDVAVSDARTAVDFFGRIAELFPAVSYHASDCNPKVYVLERGRMKVTLGCNGALLEIVWPPFVFNATRRDSYRTCPVNPLVRFLVQRLGVPSLIRDYRSGRIKARDLFLSAPVALRLATRDPRFQLSQHDLFTPLRGSSHIVRAMNVLNPLNFSAAEFGVVLSHIHAGLSVNGLFVTGSNQEAGTPVHGGVYEKTAQGFRKVWQSGEGSPIDMRIMSVTR